MPAMHRNVKAMSSAAAVMRLIRTTAAPAAITPSESTAKTRGSTKSKRNRVPLSSPRGRAGW